MDYEKEYKEARERAREFLKDWEECGAVGEALEKARNIFPELKESEDEKTRKKIIEYMKEQICRLPSADCRCKDDEEEMKQFMEWIAWVEKQGEQKPVEWSEEDEQFLLVCKNALAKYQVSDKWDAGIISRWLENKTKALAEKLANVGRNVGSWKPSKKQIIALEVVIDCYGHDTETSKIVTSLLEQLKAL